MKQVNIGKHIKEIFDMLMKILMENIFVFDRYSGKKPRFLRHFFVNLLPGRKVTPKPKSVFHSCIWPSADLSNAMV